MSKAASVKPNFFCLVGLPKCGTTWLADYLRAHPSVFVPFIKELQLFSRRYRPDLYDWMDDVFRKNLNRVAAKIPAQSKDRTKNIELFKLFSEIYSMPYIEEDSQFIESYRSLFTGSINGQTLAFGELSTTYCTLPDAGLRLLDSCFDHTKYIVVIRDPVERFWSHIKHKARQFDSDPISDFSRWLSDKELLEIANYRSVMSRLADVIPRERVCTVFYEDLFNEHGASTLRSITDFLGIDYIGADNNEKIYAGPEIDLPDKLRSRLSDTVQDSYAFCQQEFGELPVGWKQ